MANERAYTLRNVGTEEAPVWELWFAVTVADSVMMSDKDGETRTIVDYVNQKIADLIGGAPATYDTLKEIADYITAHKDVSDALNAAIANKADKTLATSNADGLMSKADKAKLTGIDPGANNYIHPTTPGNKHVPSGGAAGQVLKYSADGTAAWGEDKDTTYSDMKGASASAAGANGLVPAPAANTQGKFLRGDGTWQNPPNTTYGVATSAADGLLSKSDKAKLDGVATGANKYTHPTTAGNKHIPAGGASGQILRWSADGTATWGADNNTTYNVATESSNGLMSKEDKAKLNNAPTIGFGTSYPGSAPNNSLYFLIKT